MSSIIGNNINSAIGSGMSGLQNAYQGMTQASMNIAQRSAQPVEAQNGTSGASPKVEQQGLSVASDSVTSDVIALKLNSIHAQASAKVLDTAFDTVGTLIDTLS